MFEVGTVRVVIRLPFFDSWNKHVRCNMGDMFLLLRWDSFFNVYNVLNIRTKEKHDLDSKALDLNTRGDNASR